MARINFGNSIMEEFEKIALEKGWVINKEAALDPNIQRMWGSLNNEQKDKIIPGWHKLLRMDLEDALSDPQIAEPLLKEYRSNMPAKEVPKAEPKPKGNKTIYRLQQILHSATGMPMSRRPRGVPDGFWGPMSAAAWNKYIKSFNMPPFIIEAEGNKLPPIEDIKWILENSGSAKKKPAETGTPVDVELPTIPSPSPVSTGPATKEHIPMRVDDMAMVASAVSELTSLANDLEEMGEEKVALAIDEQLKLYKEATDKLYDVIGETGEQLINSAHPGGGPTLVPAAEEGGKVETIVEEHKKVVDKTLKQPTGKVAEILTKLIVTANQLEDAGDIEAAKLVDKTIGEVQQAIDPFVNRSAVSETANSEDNEVSVKIAANKELDKYIGLWDKAMHIYNSLYKDIFGFATGSFRLRLKPDVTEGVRALREAFKSALPKINDTSSVWKEGWLDKKQLITRLSNIIGILNVGHDKIAAGMTDAFYFDSDVDGGITRYKKMIKLWWKLLGAVKNDLKREKAPKKFEQGDEVIRVKYLKLLKFLKSFVVQNVIPISKMLGDAKRKELETWIKNRLYNIEKRKSDDKLHHVPTAAEVVGLQQWIQSLRSVIKKASVNQNIIRTAQPPGAPPIALPGMKGPAKRRAPSGRRVVRKDPQVEALQQAMITAGFLAPGEADGWWGPKTAAAYNKMVGSAPIGVNIPQIPNPKRQRHAMRPINMLAYATKLAQYMASEKRKNYGAIPIGGGFQISLLDVFKPARKFMELLSQKFQHNMSAEGALQVVEELQNYVDTNKAAMTVKDPRSVQQWKEGLARLSKSLPGTPTVVFRGGKAKPGGQQPGQAGQFGQAGTPTGTVKVYLPGSLLGKYKGEGINSAADFAEAFGSLPLRQWLRSFQIFKNISRKLGMTPQTYVKQVNDILSDIQIAIQKYRGKVDYFDIGGKKVPLVEVVNFINMYQGDVNLLAEDLKADLNAPEELKPKVPTWAK